MDVATGTEGVLNGPAGQNTILYYAKEGIYFNHGWEGTAWIPDLNPADPHPVFSHYTGSNLPNQILRRDLNGGATVRRLYQPGKTVIRVSALGSVS